MPFFADCLQGRIDLHSAVYRKSHDGETVVWMTLDGLLVFRYASSPFQKVQTNLYNEAKTALPERPADFGIEIFKSDWYKASHNLWERIETQMYNEGFFNCYMLLNGLIEYPSLSIKAAIEHESLFIRGLTFLDRRFGKRQLVKVEEQQLSAFEVLCYNLRMEAEAAAKQVV